MEPKIRVGIVGATVTVGGSGWGANAHVPALKALAAKVDHDLTIAPLDGLVGAFVPDLDLACTVLARGDLARELEVFERMVLDVDSEMVLLGIGWNALGNRPRDANAVFLQPKVPVQPARVVLLDHEPRRPFSLRGTLAPGSGVRLKSRLASYSASFFATTKD